MREGAGTPDVELNPVADEAAMGSIDRRTPLVGAADALVAAGLTEPRDTPVCWRPDRRRASPRPWRVSSRRYCTALHDPSMHAPGGILHVRSPKLGRWTPAFPALAG